jgi:D-alanyl-D-alanine carboxypeptidase
MITSDRSRRRRPRSGVASFSSSRAARPPGPSNNSSHAGTTTATEAPCSSALKRIDPAAFQASVEAAAEVLLVPGRWLCTPQGNFAAVAGTTQLGANTASELSARMMP